MGRKKFSVDFQLMFRLLKLFLFIRSVGTLAVFLKLFLFIRSVGTLAVLDNLLLSCVNTRQGKVAPKRLPVVVL